jgi:hypothetical protein
MMMTDGKPIKYSLSVLCFVLWCSLLHSQAITTFQKVITSNLYNRNPLAAATTDNGMVVSDDAFVVKLNASGDTLWKRTIALPNDLSPTQDGGVVISGDYFVVLNANGGIVINESINQSIWNPRHIVSAIQLPNRQYMAITDSAVLVHLDATGQIIWQKAYRAPPYQFLPNRIRLSGSAELTLYGEYAVGMYPHCQAKIDTAGNVLWANYYNAGASGCSTSDGGSASLDATASGTITLLKTDSSGAVSWTKSFGNKTSTLTNDFRSAVLQQTTDGGFIACAWGMLGSGDTNIYVIKTNALGDTLWTRTYGAPDMAEIMPSICQTSDHCYFAVSMRCSNCNLNIGSDKYLIKFNNQGIAGGCNTTASDISVSSPPVTVATPLSLTWVTAHNIVKPADSTLFAATLSLNVLCLIAGTPEFESPFASVSVFPNPCNSRIQIKCSTMPAGLINMDIVDLEGRLLMHQMFITSSQDFTDEMNTSNLADGMYFVRITGGNQRFVVKVVKQ